MYYKFPDVTMADESEKKAKSSANRLRLGERQAQQNE